MFGCLYYRVLQIFIFIFTWTHYIWDHLGTGVKSFLQWFLLSARFHRGFDKIRVPGIKSSGDDTMSEGISIKQVLE